MLSITQSQYDAFASRSVDSWISRTCRHLRDRFRRQTTAMESGHLRALVLDALAGGRRRGIHSAYDARRYAECLVVHGPSFPDGDDLQWARSILERDDLCGRRKMNAISDYEAFVLRHCP